MSVSETHMVTVTKTVMVTNTPPPSVARAALGSSKLITIGNNIICKILAGIKVDYMC